MHCRRTNRTPRGGAGWRCWPAPSADELGERLGTLPDYRVLRGPEAGLVMVRGRTGGGGAPFNLGEMTATRCTVRTETRLRRPCLCGGPR